MTFEAIIGNDGVKERLSKAIGSGRQSHAYLFTGPKGVGKYRMALEFARTVMAVEEGWAKWDPEGNDGIKAQSFIQASEEKRSKAAARGKGKGRNKAEKASSGVEEVGAKGPIHPDLDVFRPIGPTRSITIDQVREISLAVSCKPVSGSKKVFILDEADRLRVEAANSILKVLEEPPPFMVIILITSEFDRILPTIKSRCAVINFKPLGEGDLSSTLSTRYGMPGDQADFLARYTKGSIGVALSLASDTEFMERRASISDRLLGLHSGTPLDLLDFCKEFGDKKEGASELLGLMRTTFRDIVMVRALGPGARKYVSNIDIFDRIKGCSDSWTDEKLAATLHSLGELENAWAYTRGNLNFRLGLEACLFKGLAGIKVSGIFSPVTVSDILL